MPSKHNFDELFSEVVKQQASDLHITVGRHPMLRVEGHILPLPNHPVMTPDIAQDFIFAMITEEQQREYLQEKELDFTYSFRDRARFRVNLFHQRGFMGAALRLIPPYIRNFEELNLPQILKDFTNRQQGFFLCVGPTGHGKSTTLAAMVQYINQTRQDHIITIEDPIEYLFTSDQSIVVQREIGSDTKSFGRALRSMFREDIDIAMIGEMRDAETIATAVTAAETGHLIFSTLHTNNAAQTIDRIIDTFPPAQQSQIRSQLALVLIGIVSQRLVPRISGGLIPAIEVLVATPAIRNLIRENKVHELDLVIDTGAEEGMISLNRSLADLVRRGEIAMEHALMYATDAKDLENLMR
ncbi:MAG: type IV pilus twitching motility protein PilT [Patescibacteria group bacterium]